MRIVRSTILWVGLVIFLVFALFSLEDRLVVWSNGARYNIPRNMEWSPQVEKEIAARQLREATASTQPTTAPLAQAGTSRPD